MTHWPRQFLGCSKTASSVAGSVNDGVRVAFGGGISLPTTALSFLLSLGKTPSGCSVVVVVVVIVDDDSAAAVECFLDVTPFGPAAASAESSSVMEVGEASVICCSVAVGGITDGLVSGT